MAIPHLSITRASHPLRVKKTTRRRAPQREVPVIARSRDVSSYIVNALQRNAFVRDVIVLTVAIPPKTLTNGNERLKTLARKTRKHSRIDSVLKIPKAPKRSRKFIIWVVNARNPLV
jgi:hypothetical protein